MEQISVNHQVTIRKIREDEFPQLLDLYKRLHPDDDPLPAESEVRQIWKSIMDDPRLHYIVADRDGQVVSTCCLVVIPNLTRGARPYGLIENVVTHTDHRCKGLGAAVLRYALDIAWAADCYKVMLMTGSRKSETLRFYEKAGFRSGVKTGFIAYPSKGPAEGAHINPCAIHFPEER